MLRTEDDRLILMGRQLDRFFKSRSASGSRHDAFDGISACVVQFCVDGEISFSGSAIGEMSHCERRSDRDRAGLDKIYCAPKSHILIRWARIPVDPVDAEILVRGRCGFDRDDVAFAWSDHVGDVEIVGAICACDGVRVGDLVAVGPDFTAVVDATEVEPNAIVFCRKCGCVKLLSVPPSAGVRAVGGHREIGEVLSDRVTGSGNLPEVGTEVGIGKDAGFYLSRKDGARHRSFQPAGG